MGAPLIRPAATVDLGDFVRVWNEVWPTLAVFADDLHREDETLPAQNREARWVATLEEQVVGIARAYRHPGNFHPGKWIVDVAVLAPYRGRGIGTALFREIDQLTDDPDRMHLSSFVREGDLASLAFAEKRGFRETNRDFESTLTLAEVDPTKLKVPPSGVEIRTFAALDTPDFRPIFHELFEAVRCDIPRLDPPVRLTFDFFETQVLNSPKFLREGSLIATTDGLPVGFSLLYQGANEGWLDQSLTAVLRDYRGRGVATALKHEVVRWAIRSRFQVIRTDNDSRKAAMWAINERLGFRRGPSLIALRTAS